MKRFAVSWLAVMATATQVLAASTLHTLAPEPQALFERNLGQYDEAVRYRAKLASLDAAIGSDGSIVLRPRNAAGTVTLRPGSAVPRTIDASEPSEYRTHYFRGGDRPMAVTGVPHFGRVVVRDVLPGIDLAYHARDGWLEFDFIVAGGADPSQIELEVSNADAIRLEPDGTLALAKGGSTIRQRKPVAYQMRDGERVEVACGYRQVGEAGIAFEIGAYDASLPLVIDPVIEYSSYVGGTAEEAATAVKPGPGDFIYVAGWTNSSNFPVAGAYDSSLSGTDVFVSKINLATGKPMYSTFIGGRGSDSASAIAVDAAGNAYVAGFSSGRFPTTSGAYQGSSANAGGFVAKLSPSGNTLSYSTMLMGARPAAIDVDAAGRAVVTGAAGGAFTTTAGAFQPTHGGSAGIDSGDAFVVMLNSAGTAPVFATFFGGLGTDDGRGIAIDAAGRVVIGGVTGSSDLPMVGAFQAVNGGGTSDAYVAAFDPTGSSLAYSSYLGGTDIDEIRSLAADPYGNVVVAGRTWSTNFPLVNARLPRSALLVRYVDFNNQPVYRKAFVAKISPSPLRLAFSTYSGSRSNCCDEAYAVAADGAGEVYAAGSLNSAEFSLLTPINAFMSSGYVSAKYGGSNSDAIFVTGYSRDGSGYLYQTMVAGCGDAIVCNPAAIGARLAGQVAVAGQSAVDWHPTTYANTQPARSSTGFGSDAFVMTLGLEPPALQMGITNQQPNSGEQVTLLAVSYGAGTSGTVTFWDDATSLGTAALVEGTARLDISLPAGVRRLTATLGASRTPLLLIPVTVSGS